jgi:hypothetical protein
MTKRNPFSPQNKGVIANFTSTGVSIGQSLAVGTGFELKSGEIFLLILALSMKNGRNNHHMAPY